MMMTDAKEPVRSNPRGFRVLVCMAVLSGLWLAAASRVHVNASTSDRAWGYFAAAAHGRAPDGATWCSSTRRRRRDRLSPT